MVKRLVLSALCILLLLAVGCGEKYGDAIEVRKDFIDLMSDYIAALDRAENAKAVASAMNSYAEGVEALAPEIRKINKKYPELRDPANQPEKFKKATKEQQDVMSQFGSTFMKTMPYMKNPDVRQAQERMTKAMQSMGEQ